MNKNDDAFDSVYMAGRTQFEIQSIVQQATEGNITSEAATDQIEDLFVCCIMEGLDYVLNSLYSVDNDMYKHVIAKTVEALQHRSEHSELYFDDPDVEVQ